VFMKRLFDDFINGSTPLLFYIVMLGFSAALALTLPMAIRFIARQFLPCRPRRTQVRKGKKNGAETAGVSITDPTSRMILRSLRERKENETFPPFWPEDYRVFPDEPPFAGWQNSRSGLHPGGKTFSLLRSKNPICETASWIALL